MADLAGRAQADDAGDVERAGAHAALVAAAVNLLGKLHARVAAANIQRAHALRPVDLVAGEREQVDVVGLHVDGNLADGLHGVGVEDDALLVAELADLGDGLDDADLVVRVHDADEDRLASSMARFRSSMSMRPSACTGR
jgi:hypothetical protein